MTPDKNKTFEQSLTDLEKVVRELEGGNLTLDQSLAAFEKGVGLTRECEKKLQEAKGRVEKIVQDAQGKVKTEEFEVKE